MDAKEALNLGVLQKIDEETIRKQIPDPSSWGESLTTWSTDNLIKRLETARNSLNQSTISQLQSVGLEQIGQQNKDVSQMSHDEQVNDILNSYNK